MLTRSRDVGSRCSDPTYGTSGKIGIRSFEQSSHSVTTMPKSKNTTFTGGNPTWANACVGENGLPDYWEYAKGFSRAATILIDAALQKYGTTHPVDELVYPVCFNMRHSVELRLKGAISELTLIESRRDQALQFDLAGSHDIRNIWSFFIERSLKVDDRYKTIIDRVDKRINDISEVDATGQTFRYPQDTESRKHLVDVAIINFFVLKSSFSELEAALDDLHRLNKYLRYEYSWGTHTRRLSRKNIFELASLLPPRSTWSDESFAAKKNMIKQKFNIGSDELSKIIKCIEANFELAPKIEISIDLLGVEEADIYQFFFYWFKWNDLPPDKDTNNSINSQWGADHMLKELSKDDSTQADVWGAVQPNLTPEKLAGLSALFYFALELDFSERYTQIYESKLREAEVALTTSKNFFRSQYFRIFKNRSAVNKILKSLYFLHKGEIADRLVITHSLDGKVSWLNNARNRFLFRKPEHCGYANNIA